jgi:hypothetical protein
MYWSPGWGAGAGWIGVATWACDVNVVGIAAAIIRDSIILFIKCLFIVVLFK